MLAHGAMYVPYILENGEYYRLLTSIFLHFGFQHLFNNMVMLLMIGWNLELEMGRVRYVITYFVSGLAGNILSGFLDIRLQDFAVSAGASGAIFGITGALLYVVVCNHGRLRDISGRGMFVMIAISLYFSFSSTGVDNAAHVGGLAAEYYAGSFCIGSVTVNMVPSPKREDTWIVPDGPGQPGGRWQAKSGTALLVGGEGVQRQMTGFQERCRTHCLSR